MMNRIGLGLFYLGVSLLGISGLWVIIEIIQSAIKRGDWLPVLPSMGVAFIVIGIFIEGLGKK